MSPSVQTEVSYQGSPSPYQQPVSSPGPITISQIVLDSPSENITDTITDNMDFEQLTDMSQAEIDNIARSLQNNINMMPDIMQNTGDAYPPPLPVPGDMHLNMMSQGNNVMSQGGNMMSPGGNMMSPSGNVMSPGGSVMSPGGGMMSPGGTVMSQGGNMMSGGNVMQQGRLGFCRFKILTPNLVTRLASLICFL